MLIAPWSELSWQALNLHTPGSLPPQFLSIAFSGVICMAVLLPWGILLRRNSAAHRRVLILATIAISDAGFSRLLGLFLPAPTSFTGTYLFYEGGNLSLIVLLIEAFDKLTSGRLIYKIAFGDRWVTSDRGMKSEAVPHVRLRGGPTGHVGSGSWRQPRGRDRRQHRPGTAWAQQPGDMTITVTYTLPGARWGITRTGS
jgi:hypothetical protein